MSRTSIESDQALRQGDGDGRENGKEPASNGNGRSAPVARDDNAGNRDDDHGKKSAPPTPTRPPRGADAATPDQHRTQTDGNPDQQAEENNPPPEEPKKPPLLRRPIFWVVLLAVVIIGGIVGIVLWLDLRYKVSTDDAFVSAHNTTVSPRVSGHVEAVWVDDNQEVKQGTLLVTLDPHDFEQTLKGYQAALEQSNAQLVQAQAQLASAHAQVAQAEADVNSAQANATQAADDLQRYENIEKSDPRAVSRQQFDQAKASARTTAAQLDANRAERGAAEAQVKVAQAQIVAAQAAIDKAKADVENATLQLSYTKIYAATDGQVTNRSVEVGNYVTPGQALMALVPRNVWITANYKETQLKGMREGQPVKIHVDAFDMDIDGHVQSIQAGSGAAFSLLPPENATGNYVKVVQRVPVKITLDAIPARRLAPGMSVEPTVDIHP